MNPAAEDMMRANLRRLAQAAAAAGAGYIVYQYGFWEPLRTIVVCALVAPLALGAMLLHCKHREAHSSYAQIAGYAAALGFWHLAVVASGSSVILGGLALAAATGSGAIAMSLTLRDNVASLLRARRDWERVSGR